MVNYAQQEKRTSRLNSSGYTFRTETVVKKKNNDRGGKDKKMGQGEEKSHPLT